MRPIHLERRLEEISSKGVVEVLVVKVHRKSKRNMNEDKKLIKAFFESSDGNFKSGVEGCSNNQLRVRPFQGTLGGQTIVDGIFDYEVTHFKKRK